MTPCSYCGSFMSSAEESALCLLPTGAGELHEGYTPSSKEFPAGERHGALWSKVVGASGHNCGPYSSCLSGR